VFNFAKVELHSEHSNQKNKDHSCYDPGVKRWPSDCTARVLIRADLPKSLHGDFWRPIDDAHVVLLIRSRPMQPGAVRAWQRVSQSLRPVEAIEHHINRVAPLLVIDLDHLLAYALRVNSRGGEGVLGVGRKQPFAGFVSVLLLRQVLHGTENYGLAETGIRMVVRKRR